MFVVLKLQNMPCLITMPRNYSRFVLWHNIVLKFVYTQSYIYVYKMCVCMSVYICIYLHTHINKIQKTHIKKFLLSFSLFYYLENINSRVISIEFYCSICGSLYLTRSPLRNFKISCIGVIYQETRFPGCGAFRGYCDL